MEQPGMVNAVPSKDISKLETREKRKELFFQVRKAQKLIQKEEFTRAFNLLNRLEKLSENLNFKTKIAQMKVYCLVQVGNIQSAQEYMEHCLNEYPMSGQFNVLGAGMYRKMGDFHKANRLYMRAIVLFRENAQYALQYAVFLKENNRPKEALKIIRRCIQERRVRFEPDESTYLLYLEMGVVLYQLGLYWRSLAVFRYCKKRDPHFPFNDMVADICLRNGNYEKAHECMNEHFMLWGSEDPDDLFLYAKILSGLEDYDQALEKLQQCRDIWGELVITSGDLKHFAPLMQDGTLRKLKNMVLDI